MNVVEKLDSVDPCFDVFEKEIGSESPDRSSSAYECLSQIALRVTEFNSKWNDMVIEALERSANGEPTESQKEICKTLLRLFHKLKRNDKLVERACKTVEDYPDDPTAYEWICKIYVDKIDDDSFDIQVRVWPDFCVVANSIADSRSRATLRNQSSNTSQNWWKLVARPYHYLPMLSIW